MKKEKKKTKTRTEENSKYYEKSKNKEEIVKTRLKSELVALGRRLAK